MKTATGYKEKVVRVPTGYQYTCDTCGYSFKKGERKVSYIQSGKTETQYGCYDKPCTPFSNPKDYEYVWDSRKQGYVWQKLKPPTGDKS